MNNKKVMIAILALLIMSLILAACAPSSSSAFPTGKFIKSGETDYGLKFSADGTFSVFQGDVTYVTGTYEAADYLQAHGTRPIITNPVQEGVMDYLRAHDIEVP